ncbi:MAG TPA: hypothetical protein VGH44_06325 [Candidatus Saccharimonadia bacterium]
MIPLAYIRGLFQTADGLGGKKNGFSLLREAVGAKPGPLAGSAAGPSGAGAS